MSRWHTPKPTGQRHDRPRHPHQTDGGQVGRGRGGVAALVRARESPDQGGSRVHERTRRLARIAPMAGTQRRDGGQVHRREGAGEVGRRGGTLAMPMATVMVMLRSRPSHAM